MKELTSNQHQHQHQQQENLSENAKKSSTTSNRLSSSQITASYFEKLIEACKRKDLDDVKLWLSKHPEACKLRDRFSRTLLHYAAILLQASDCLDSSNNHNLINNNQDKSLDCFSFLTDFCDQRLLLKQDLDGLSVLHLAVISSNLPLVKYILFFSNNDHQRNSKFKKLIYLLDNERHSALHWAVITNQLQCVKWLIESSGSVELAHEPDLNLSTPLHYATQTRDYPKYRRQLRRMIMGVVRSKSCSLGSSSSFSSDYEANFDQTEDNNQKQQQQQQQERQNVGINAEKRNLEILEYLVNLEGINLECHDMDQRTPLLWAASSGNRQAIELLISKGANLLSCDSNKLSALHCAASHGYTDCLEALLNGDPVKEEEQVKLMDKLNCTPLFYAILSGNNDCLELLLDRGAQGDWQDSKGRTVAHFAALKGQLGSLKLMEERKLNLWLPNKQGDLPLHYAIKSGRRRVVAWLLDHSPYENAVNAINNFGRAPIHIAVLKDNLDLCSFLIERGANLNQLVKMRRTSSSIREATSGGAERRKSSSDQQQQIRYETALDMAQNLRRLGCRDLLLNNKAKFAAEVMAQRELLGLGTNRRPNLGSLFEVQPVGGTSPIGFDTPVGGNTTDSCSSESSALIVAGKQAQSTTTTEVIGGLKRSETASIQSDSTGSSALSQNSLTSVRGIVNSNSNDAHSLINMKSNADGDGRKEQQQQVNGDNERGRDNQDTYGRKRDPYKGGGISYNNKHMNASIKCKLYECNHQHSGTSMSFPSPMSSFNKHESSTSTKLNTSLPTNLTNAGQEIITNVNVYTGSPMCQNCTPSAVTAARSGSMGGGNRPFRVLNRKGVFQDENYQSSDDTSEYGATSVEHNRFDEEENDNVAHREYQQPSQRHQEPANPLVALPIHLPPSQNYEQRLPVIVSDREEAGSNSRSPDSTSLEPSPEQLDGTLGSRQIKDGKEPFKRRPQLSRESGARFEEEPRFDKFEHQLGNSASSKRTTTAGEKYRSYIKSPVGEYIRGSPYADLVSLAPTDDEKVASSSRSHSRQHMPDFSQVRPRVDSRRSDHSPSHQARVPQNLSQSPIGQEPRNLSRQTVIKTRRLSVDSVELASSVARSIRKYKQETRLFEELQNLKRSQIRSGKANEALLVKRLVEHFHNQSQLMADFVVVGLENYHGPYTYKSYERYLYDQLRKLSDSNRAKLGKRLKHFNESFEQHHPVGRNYLDEDMRAEMELRRVMGTESSTGESEESVILEQSGALEEIRVRVDDDYDADEVKKGQEGDTQTSFDREIIEHRYVEEPANVDLKTSGLNEELQDQFKPVEGEELKAERRSSLSSNVASSSRRSSIEAELDRLKSIPLGFKSDANERIATNLEADLLCSSIITDCLGNLSRCNSPPLPVDNDIKEEAGEIENKEDEDYNSQIQVSSGPSGRRRSVINIGNKMDVVYHDIGIEINPAPPGDSESDIDASGDVASSPVEEHSIESKDKLERVVEEKEEEMDLEPGLETNEQEARDEPEEDKSSGVTSGANSIVQLVGDDLSEKAEILNELETQELSLVCKQPSLDKPLEIPARSRRASSPQESHLSMDSGKSSGSSSRRMGRSVDFGQPMVQKKIFNGYDLDEMRDHFRKLREKSATVAINSDEGDKRDVVARIPRRRAIKSNNKQLKKQRIKLPMEPYEVKVDMDEVRSRWNYIKSRERIRKREQEIVIQSSLDHQEGEAKVIDRDQRREGERIEASRMSAKSQPNLSKDDRDDDDDAFTDESRSNTPAFSLIYEINLNSKERNIKSTIMPKEREGSKKSSRGRWWCQRRVIKIVDVRTLKRTISLPESLIYSNNLFKKFNILKL